MEQTPLPPQLVSDDAIAKVMADQFKTTRDHVVACGASRSVRNIYEADRQRTREVVQALVDALDRLSKEMDCGDWGEVDVNGDVTRPLAHDILAMPGGCPKCKTDKVLALAKSQMNIEPTKP